VGSTFYSPVVRLSTAWQLVTVDYPARRAGTALSLRITNYPSVSSESFFIDDVTIERLPAGAVARSVPTEHSTATQHTVATPRLSASIGPNPLRRAGLLRVQTTVPGPLRVRLFDGQGRRVRTLIKRAWVPAGRHEALFDARDDRRARLPAGLYFYRVRAAEGVLHGKIVVGR
jgi:hypothetical protein